MQYYVNQESKLTAQVCIEVGNIERQTLEDNSEGRSHNLE